MPQFLICATGRTAVAITQACWADDKRDNRLKYSEWCRVSGTRRRPLLLLAFCCCCSVGSVWNEDGTGLSGCPLSTAVRPSPLPPRASHRPRKVLCHPAWRPASLPAAPTLLPGCCLHPQSRGQLREAASTGRDRCGHLLLPLSLRPRHTHARALAPLDGRLASPSGNGRTLDRLPQL